MPSCIVASTAKNEQHLVGIHSADVNDIDELDKTESFAYIKQQQLRDVRIHSTATKGMYELAQIESFGFFDDIDEDTWRNHQYRARYEPIYYSMENPNKYSTNVAKWLLNNVDPIFTCPNLRRVGGRGDGPKWTCDPHRLIEKDDCLIYSIGSKGIYLFEDGINNVLRDIHAKQNTATASSPWLPNCEIHVFDPNPKYARTNDAQMNNIHYHAIGLKSSYERSGFGKFLNRFEFLSLPEIQQRLNHTHRRIDVFKIDCEGCEWSTYLDWLQPNIDIRQILIETHSLKCTPNIFFDRFFDMGYVLYSKEANTHPNSKDECYEWGFLKLHPNFLQRTTNLMNVTFV
jgi:Methyltransferase domain